MEKILDDFNKSQPANVYEWLWKEATLSDVNVRLTPALVRTSTINTSESSASGCDGGSGDADQDLDTPVCALPSPAHTSSAHDGILVLRLSGPLNTREVQLQLQPQPPAISSASQHEPVYQLHAAVLCSNSAYFRTRITSGVGASSPGCKRSRGDALDEVMDAVECEAAASVLHFFYTSQLRGQEGGSCSAELLVRMMEVADRWQASLALTAISTVLCKLKPDIFPAPAVYSLSPVLRASPVFRALTLHASFALMSVFGDAEAVAKSRALVHRFVSLPHAAVLALLKSDALLTDAEATVVLLLSEWCLGDHGRACTKRELQKLNGCIRYSRLSMPYLTELCESLDTPRLTTKQRMDLLHFRSLSDASQEATVINMPSSNPKSWYLPRRGSMFPYGELIPTTTLTLKVPEAKLYAFLTAAKGTAGVGPTRREIMSEETYAHGFWWTLGLSSEPQGLWCGIQVHGVGSLLGKEEGFHLAHGVACDYRIKICRGGVAKDDMHDMAVAYPVNSRGSGGILGSQDRTSESPFEKGWWQRYVVDGVVTIKAVVSEISL